MYRTDFCTLWEKARVGCSERTALKQVYYQGWNRPTAQVRRMRQVLRSGELGRPRGMAWGGRREGESEWGTHVNPRLIHVNVWQKPLKYCKVISLQLIKINEKKKRKVRNTEVLCFYANSHLFVGCSPWLLHAYLLWVSVLLLVSFYWCMLPTNTRVISLKHKLNHLTHQA